MTIRIDCSKIPSKCGCHNHSVIKALAIALAYKSGAAPEDFDPSSVRGDQPIDRQVSGGKKGGSIVEFDPHFPRKSDGAVDARHFGALAMLYAWREYCWDDLDPDSLQRAFDAGASPAEWVDEAAADFDISSVDPYMKSDMDKKGLLTGDLAGLTTGPRF